MLRTLGMQVADKDVALVLVELHNRELFAAGLVLVGTLAFAAGAVLDTGSGRLVELEQRSPVLKIWAPDDQKEADDRGR